MKSVFYHWATSAVLGQNNFKMASLSSKKTFWSLNLIRLSFCCPFHPVTRIWCHGASFAASKSTRAHSLLLYFEGSEKKFFTKLNYNLLLFWQSGHYAKKVLLAIFGSFFVDASKIVDDVVNVGSNLSFFNLGHFCLLTSPFGKKTVRWVREKRKTEDRNIKMWVTLCLC